MVRPLWVLWEPGRVRTSLVFDRWVFLSPCRILLHEPSVTDHFSKLFGRMGCWQHSSPVLAHWAPPVSWPHLWRCCTCSVLWSIFVWFFGVGRARPQEVRGRILLPRLSLRRNRSVLQQEYQSPSEPQLCIELQPVSLYRKEKRCWQHFSKQKVLPREGRGFSWVVLLNLSIQSKDREGFGMDDGFGRNSCPLLFFLPPIFSYFQGPLQGWSCLFRVLLFQIQMTQFGTHQYSPILCPLNSRKEEEIDNFTTSCCSWSHSSWAWMSWAQRPRKGCLHFAVSSYLVNKS